MAGIINDVFEGLAVNVTTSVTAGTSVNATTTVTAGTGLTVSTGNADIISGNVNIGTSVPSNPYDLSIEKLVAGNIGISIQNISANPAASATVQYITEVGAGDAYSAYIVNGGSNWSVGLDNSDSDSLKITTGISPSAGTEVLTATTAGVVTMNGGVVNVGTNAADSAINIGTAATAGRTITIGNITGTSSVVIDSGTGGVSVGASATAHATTLGSTNTTSSTTIQSGSGALNITSTNGALTINSGTGALGISNDASATTVSLATGAAVKTVTLGSTNTTSATTVQSGSGALNITSTNGALTINSGTGALGISTDASATTVSLATGAAVKTVTLGSTNGASVTTIACGTGGASFGATANNHTTTVGTTNGTATTVVQAGSGGITLTGAVTSANAISITSGNLTLTSGNLAISAATTSAVGQITQGGTRLLHTMGGVNSSVYLGGSSGNFTLSGGGNTCVGFNTGNALTTGGFNCLIGWAAGQTFTTGSNNVAIGGPAGNSLTTSDSHNICINNAGVAGNNNTCRIGAATGTGTQQLNRTFIHGIRGITTGNADAIAVLVDSAGQLGTVSSSIRYKHNVQDLGSTHILELRPVSFNYKVDNRPAVGLIAEEVEKVMPELVARDIEGNPESVKYHDLPVYLLNEIQRLTKRIEVLEAEVRGEY